MILVIEFRALVGAGSSYSKTHTNLGRLQLCIEAVVRGSQLQFMESINR